MSGSLLAKIRRDEQKEKDENELLTEEEKELKIFEMKMRGMPVSGIAHAFGMTPGEVRKSIQRYSDKFRHHYETESPANLIAETLAFYERLEEICLYEIDAIEQRSTVKTSAGVSVNQTTDPEKRRYIETAGKARDARIKLLLETGLIPKEPEKLHSIMYKEGEGETEKKLEKRSKDEIRQDIENLIGQVRSLKDT